MSKESPANLAKVSPNAILWIELNLCSKASAGRGITFARLRYGIFPGMPIASAATRTLDLLAVPYRIFEHPTLPTSLEDAARQRGQEIGQVIRSILFRHEREYYVMVLMAGPGQISWKRVRAHLGVSRISIATEAEVLEVTGCELGTVNPLGLLQPVRILADVSVFKPEEISIGSGVRGMAIILKSKDLRNAVGTIDVGIFA
jgi:Cys-tRNA(Pro)/Cys-tRNA(Cys) deacylase